LGVRESWTAETQRDRPAGGGSKTCLQDGRGRGLLSFLRGGRKGGQRGRDQKNSEPEFGKKGKGGRERKG